MSMVIVEGLETQTLGNGDTRTGGDADGNKSLDTDARREIRMRDIDGTITRGCGDALDKLKLNATGRL